MKFKKTTMIAAGALLTAACLLGGCGDNKPQVAYFNGERVMKESPQLDAIIKDSEKKMKDLQQEAMKLATEGSEMSQEEIQKKQMEFQARAQSINMGASSQMRNKMNEVLGELAKTKKFDVVLENEKGQKAVVMGGVDITDDIIQKLQ